MTLNGARLRCERKSDMDQDYFIDICAFNENPVKPGTYNLKVDFTLFADGENEDFKFNFKYNNTNSDPATVETNTKLGICLIF